MDLERPKSFGFFKNTVFWRVNAFSGYGVLSSPAECALPVVYAYMQNSGIDSTRPAPPAGVRRIEDAYGVSSPHPQQEQEEDEEEERRKKKEERRKKKEEGRKKKEKIRMMPDGFENDASRARI